METEKLVERTTGQSAPREAEPRKERQKVKGQVVRRGKERKSERRNKESWLYGDFGDLVCAVDFPLSPQIGRPPFRIPAAPRSSTTSASLMGIGAGGGRPKKPPRSPVAAHGTAGEQRKRSWREASGREGRRRSWFLAEERRGVGGPRNQKRHVETARNRKDGVDGSGVAALARRPPSAIRRPPSSSSSSLSSLSPTTLCRPLGGIARLPCTSPSHFSPLPPARHGEKNSLCGKGQSASTSWVGRSGIRAGEGKKAKMSGRCRMKLQ